MIDKEKLEAALPHLENAMNLLIELWDSLQEAEKILDREIEVDHLSASGLTLTWNIGDMLSIEDLNLILDQD